MSYRFGKLIASPFQICKQKMFLRYIQILMEQESEPVRVQAHVLFNSLLDNQNSWMTRIQLFSMVEGDHP